MSNSVYSGPWAILVLLGLGLWPATGPACEASSQAAADFLAAARSGAIDSVNGLAISPGFHSVYATHWTMLDDKRRGTLVSYSHGPDGWALDGPVFPGAKYQDYQPRLSADGRRLFFTSNRPVDGGDAPARQNVWAAQRENGRWSPPQPLQGLVSEWWDGHAAATIGGHLYFASDRDAGYGMVDIYRTSLNGLETGPLENIEALNSPGSDQDFDLDPDERYIILARYDGETEDIDLFYAVQEDGRWVKAMPLDAVNTEIWELSPTVVSDMRCLLFKRGEEKGFQTVSFDALPETLVKAIGH